MNFSLTTPRKSLSKLHRKQKLVQNSFEHFCTQLQKYQKNLQNSVEQNASEEHIKSYLRDFLKHSFYEQNEIAPQKFSGNIEADYVIHEKNSAQSRAEVLLEVKTPQNVSEMMSKDDGNKKAFQEAVLYYLWEREINKNHELKHIVITDCWKFFVFDASEFAKIFAGNKKLVKYFLKWKDGKTDNSSTAEMYAHLKTFIAETEAEITGCFFDLQEYFPENLGKNEKDPEKMQKKLTALYKFFSPEHLLKSGTVNDNNSLNKKFYAELLHIIGLEEKKVGSKKVIQRVDKKEERQMGSLLENAIQSIETRRRMHKLSEDELKKYGENAEEQIFGVALEVIILWVNRILFLKLLEGQLLTYHKKSENIEQYRFLTTEKINDFDDLHYLFFNVLAKKIADRNDDNLAKLFAKVPYLNSSLFEFIPDSLEDDIIEISDLNDSFDIEIWKQTVLTDSAGKKKSGKIKPLDYLFEFLNAYDFASESDEEVQKDQKTLISASVLGLIFEKINGYKDGSFFTPSFITMYMCRETIRRAVVEKMNEFVKSNKNLPGLQDLAGLKNLNDVYNAIGENISIDEANEVINSLKICDPAVGSGHFLVSALNEIIVIKSELGILRDKEGKKLRDYEIAIENDELVVTDDEGEIFEYGCTDDEHSTKKSVQRVQETLFEEKKLIIENCLFGVDINPNSVNICRLRLWVELLKNAYYTQTLTPALSQGERGQMRELQTLPNIDINIKCGNSLISQFDLDANLGEAFGKNEVRRYKDLVAEYKETKDKNKKWEVEKMLENINKTLRGGIQHGLFDSEEERKKREEEADIYKNSFEWRFAFPEVLDEKGKFIGFDCVIGNPPYVNVKNGISIQEKNYLIKKYSSAIKQFDLFTVFIELGFNISQDTISYIVPKPLLNNENYEKIREIILKNGLSEIISGSDIFDSANVESSIFINSKKGKAKTLRIKEILKNKIIQKSEVNKNIFDKFPFKIISTEVLKRDEVILKKLGNFSGSQPLLNITRGVECGKKDNSITNIENTYPLLRGEDIGRYSINFSGYYIDFDKNDIKKFKNLDLYRNEKILIRRVGNKILATLDKNEFITLNTIYCCFSSDKKISNIYILSLLNSSLILFYFKKIFILDDKLFPYIRKSQLDFIPIPKISPEEQKPFIEKVEKILEAKKQDPSAETSQWENEIDEMVFDLYGLSEEERGVVRGG
jgi:hypothetical protein